MGTEEVHDYIHSQELVLVENFSSDIPWHLREVMAFKHGFFGMSHGKQWLESISRVTLNLVSSQPSHIFVVWSLLISIVVVHKKRRPRTRMFNWLWAVLGVALQSGFGAQNLLRAYRRMMSLTHRTRLIPVMMWCVDTATLLNVRFFRFCAVCETSNGDAWPENKVHRPSSIVPRKANTSWVSKAKKLYMLRVSRTVINQKTANMIRTKSLPFSRTWYHPLSPSWYIFYVTLLVKIVFIIR